MSNEPGINETLGLLARLRDALQDFAARETRLESEFRAQTEKVAAAYETASTGIVTGLSDRLEKEQNDYAAETDRLVARNEQRLREIGRRVNVFRDKSIQKITDEEKRVQFNTQQGLQAAERTRDAANAEATTRYQENTRLATEGSEELSMLKLAAASALRSYWGFRKYLTSQKLGSETALPDTEQKSLEKLSSVLGSARADVARFKKFFLARLFRWLPLWLWFVVLGGINIVLFLLHLKGPANVGAPNPVSLPMALSPLILIFTIGGLNLIGRHQAAPLARAIAANLALAQRLCDSILTLIDARWQYDQEQLQTQFESDTHQLNADWRQSVKDSSEARIKLSSEISERGLKLNRRHEKFCVSQKDRREMQYREKVPRLQGEAEVAKRQLADAHAAKLAQMNTGYQAQWQALTDEWNKTVPPLLATLRTADAAAAAQFPDWQQPAWKDRPLPDRFLDAAPFAHLEVDLNKLAGKIPADPRLAVTGSTAFSVPLLLKYPGNGSILIETHKSGDDQAVAAINNIVFRLLSSSPPGKLSFTIFDPVGLGQNFAGMMHLADYEDSNINSRIWTQTGQFEEKLAELNEHMEKVIQMYLRNEFATIAEYNAQAGVIAERYHFLVIAAFPVNFSDTAMRRLLNVAASGARCGVYTLIHWDHRHSLPHNFVPDDLRKNSVVLTRLENVFELAGQRLPGTAVTLDAPPTPEFVTEFLRKVGQSGKDSNRVEVPFMQVAPPEEKIWSEDTSEELRVPIGRSGATKLQYLAIGKATRQHALIAGKTGSGKSTLFHVIITNLALWCSPEQVEFYLVDFKKGVEFKCYASQQLPHARVVAIESDRAFGLSVLQRVDEELRRRGDLYRQAGAQNLEGYKRTPNSQPMPRTLLMIDEFQEFFTEEDHVSQNAAVLLDRIVRQGRAFGIHVLLGSQTLGGAYTLARATIGQMVIRIALQCNEADAYLIMDQDNPAPRLLTRPGEGIYNDTAGSIEGNSPFQAVWLSDEERDQQLAKVRTRAQAAGKPQVPFVFEGNAPADVRDNAVLTGLLNAPKPSAAPAIVRTFLGAPNAIKGPTEAGFQKQSGSNLLVVGQADESAHVMLSIAIASLAAQYPKDGARFVIIDSTPAGFPQRNLMDQVLKSVPQEVIQIDNANLAETLTQLAEELKQAESHANGPVPATFVFIHGLQNFKRLRAEDEFNFSSSATDAANPANLLQTLITEGPKSGIHVIVTCDTYLNVNRCLGRKLLAEFGLRVLFQMSASDSASLSDSPDASTLGIHRAMLYSEREGRSEIFRPYLLPGNDWAETVGQKLSLL